MRVWWVLLVCVVSGCAAESPYDQRQFAYCESHGDCVGTGLCSTDGCVEATDLPLAGSCDTDAECIGLDRCAASGDCVCIQQGCYELRETCQENSDCPSGAATGGSPWACDFILVGFCDLERKTCLVPSSSDCEIDPL